MSCISRLSIPTAIVALFAVIVAANLSVASADEPAKKSKEAKEPAKAKKMMDIPIDGVAVLRAMEGSEVGGVVLLKQKDGYVHLTGQIYGLTPGLHGFHIHEFGDLRDPFGKSAGGHFNPTNQPHGGPDDEHSHAGDLGNIEANDKGIAMVDKKAKGLKLHFVIGRSIVVHAGADDLKSQPSGDAGDRVAVGVIGFSEVKEGASFK